MRASAELRASKSVGWSVWCRRCCCRCRCRRQAITIFTFINRIWVSVCVYICMYICIYIYCMNSRHAEQLAHRAIDCVLCGIELFCAYETFVSKTWFELNLFHIHKYVNNIIISVHIIFNTYYCIYKELAVYFSYIYTPPSVREYFTQTDAVYFLCIYLIFIYRAMLSVCVCVRYQSKMRLIKRIVDYLKKKKKTE